MQSNLFRHVEGRLPCVSFSHDESDEDAVCSSSDARDYFNFWGMFELTIKESEGERTTPRSPSALVPVLPISRFSIVSSSCASRLFSASH